MRRHRLSEWRSSAYRPNRYHAIEHRRNAPIEESGRWESLGIFTIGIFLVTAMGTGRRSFGHGRLINLSLMVGSILVFYAASILVSSVIFIVLFRIAGRRFIIYGALAGSAIYLIFMRILAEIIVIATLLIRYFCLDTRDSRTRAQPNE